MFFKPVFNVFRIAGELFIFFTSEMMKEIRLKIVFFTPVFSVFKIAGELFYLFCFLNDERN